MQPCSNASGTALHPCLRVRASLQNAHGAVSKKRRQGCHESSLGGVSVPDPALLSVLAKSRKLQALGSVVAELHGDEAAAVSAADGLKERQLLEETSPGCVALAHPFLGI